jgi:hypothetical protein
MLLQAKGVTQLHPNEWCKIGVEWECGGLGGRKVLKAKGLDLHSRDVADVTALDGGVCGELGGLLMVREKQVPHRRFAAVRNDRGFLGRRIRRRLPKLSFRMFAQRT